MNQFATIGRELFFSGARFFCELFCSLFFVFTWERGQPTRRSCPCHFCVELDQGVGRQILKVVRLASKGAQAPELLGSPLGKHARGA